VFLDDIMSHDVLENQGETTRVYLFEGGKKFSQRCCGGGWQCERDAVDLIASSTCS